MSKAMKQKLNNSCKVILSLLDNKGAIDLSIHPKAYLVGHWFIKKNNGVVCKFCSLVLVKNKDFGFKESTLIHGRMILLKPMKRRKFRT